MFPPIGILYLLLFSAIVDAVEKRMPVWKAWLEKHFPQTKEPEPVAVVKQEPKLEVSI